MSHALSSGKMTRGILLAALLSGAVHLQAFSLWGAKTSVKEGMPVPWEKIAEAVWEPSRNSFDSSSFVIEDFKVEPFLTSAEGEGTPPVPFQAMAMMLGFQTAPHWAGKWFDFFRPTPERLMDYDSKLQEQVRAKLSECEKRARSECAKHCTQVRVPSDRLLMACWLHSLDAASIEKAFEKGLMNLFLERRPCTTMRSRATEAQLILLHGLPLFVMAKDGRGWFLLGFLQKDGRTVFIAVDIKDIDAPMSLSLLHDQSPMRRLAKTLEWREDWQILYAPRMTRAYSERNRMHGLDAKEE